MSPFPEPFDTTDLTLVDGRRVTVRAAIAARVRGIDADGDVVPLGTPDFPSPTPMGPTTSSR